MHRLPKPSLVPLLHSYSAEGRRIRQQLVNLGVPESTLHRPSPLRLDRERPWRIINQRRRLYACHWADWKPAWLHPAPRRLLKTTLEQRHGDVGPKWLGGVP